MYRYKKIIIAVLLIGSISANIFYFTNFREAKDKIERVNTIIASNVERSLRLSIRHIQELIETESQEAMRHSQRSIDSLTLSFNHWVDLNQSEHRPNERMQRGLASIELLRNTITHHLNNQYNNNGNQLMQYDIEMLEGVHQQLNRLLLVYHNIEDRVQELKDPIASDGGLMQIVANLEEISRLYRHSQIPNKHPKYITYEEAILISQEVFDELEDFKLQDEVPSLTVRDGVHYYELNYYDEGERVYVLWVDAIDGNIRNFEANRGSKKGNSISQNQAIVIARDFIKEFYKEELLEEMFCLEGTGNTETIYSFKFTPIDEDIQIVSDAFIVNVSADSGEIIKFSNDFINTKVIYARKANTIEDIVEKHSEEFGEMKYDGEAIVRSFFTRYKPSLTYSFRVMQNQQEMKVFFDVTTGMPVYQLYYVYHPIFNN